MIDTNKTIISSDKSSTKLLKEGTGTFIVPSGGAYAKQYGMATIPHGYGSDKLFFQIGSGSAGYVTGTILPWFSNDGRLLLYGRLNKNNLYIIARMQDSGGSGFAAFNVDYTYRIYIP